MPDTRIPLAGRQTDVLANLSNVVREKRIDESNLATASQQRELTGQTIQAQQRQLDAPELASIFMDIESIPVLLDGGKSKEAGQVGILLSDRLRETGLDSSADQLDRVLTLAAQDPVAASAFIKENYLPALRTAMPEVMRQVKNAQGELVFENLGTGEREQPQRIPSAEAPFDPSAITQESPASVKEFGFRELLSEEEQERFSSQERSSQFQRLGNEVVQFDAGGKEIARFNIGLAPQDEPANIAAAEEAQETARLKTQRVFDAGGAQGTLNVVQASADTMISAIDKILEHPGLATATGLSGTIDPRNIIPGRPASDVRILINQLKDRIFVESLNNMRAASPTGGAVGQVSDREGNRLENMMGALSRNLSDEEFINQLKLIKETTVNMRTLSQEAFDGEFGDINLTGDTELDIILQQIDALN